MKINNRTLKKTVLSGSILLLLIWLLLGTTTTVTWFTDTEDAINSFVYGNVDVKAEYWNSDTSEWKNLSQSTKLFDDHALYEPGYTQVVWLKITNEGDTAFDYRLAVNVKNYTISVNYFDQEFCLADYLRFGVAFASTETEIRSLVENRTLAKQIASNEMGLYKLNSYAAVDSQNKKSGTLQPDEAEYAVLVVTMPTSVGNEANYRGTVVPQVELGITVLASQMNAIQNIR